MFISFQNGYSISCAPSTYKSYFSEEFQQEYISIYYPTAFNGSAVRLESLVRREDGFVSLSCSCLDFYSFLTSNLLVGSLDITSSTFSNYLICPYLANALAVSVLVYDSMSVLLTNRSSEVCLSPNSVGVSVTGGVTSSDFESFDVIHSSVLQELKEELGLEVDCTEVQVEGLYISKDKLQPVAICFVKVLDLGTLGLRGLDTDFEVDSFIKVPRCALRYLDLNECTDTCKFHLNYFIQENF